LKSNHACAERQQYSTFDEIVGMHNHINERDADQDKVEEEHVVAEI